MTFSIVTHSDGHRTYQVGYRHSRPTPSVIIAVYALAQGVPVAPIRLGGSGDRWDPPPISGCFPVFIASDSEGLFGRQCPACKGYWRSGSSASICPYCASEGKIHELLTTAQRNYVSQYCALLSQALEDEKDGEHNIDMDAVSDATGKDANHPPFYYSETRQQNQVTCHECGQVDDILGKYGFCSMCGTRNDLQILETETIIRLRDRINTGGPYEDCVKDAVAIFDSFVGQYAKQLVSLIPLTPARKNRIKNRRFHNLGVSASELKTVFDIDLLTGLSDDDKKFASLMFHRRHVYEHKGGEADEKYIADSGDTSVRPKQALKESRESAHRITGLILKMATNLHRGFHVIFPPRDEPIRWHSERNKVSS